MQRIWMTVFLVTVTALHAAIVINTSQQKGPIPIGSDRECFFDDYLLNTAKTTAELKVHQPVLQDTVMIHDKPWEGDGCDYYNLFFDDQYHGVDGSYEKGTYRMYYLGWQMPSKEPNAKPSKGIVACYMESPDGIKWVRPNLGLFEFEGSKENNIVLQTGANHTGGIDNLMVFRDDNPECPPEARYKGVGSCQGALRCYPSPDGIHFTEGDVITNKGAFDSLNVVFWDERTKLYRGYIRGFHPASMPNPMGEPVRNIATIESKDFKTWTDPQLLIFDDGEDIPLYTNNVMPYYRAPQLYIGSPTRYNNRFKWSNSFEELGGKEHRKLRMEMSPRYGTVVTDCVFIVSRDGKIFHRFGEAFMRPEPENDLNWLYGDCYPARGFALTPSKVPGAPDELSLYLPGYCWMVEPVQLLRYTIRIDGFASVHAGAKEAMVVTKPFTFTGSEMHINFATSARGYVYVTLIDADGNRYPSCETFGNAIDRKVLFDDPEAVSKLAGKPVYLEFRMMDADVYSMQFR